MLESQDIRLGDPSGGLAARQRIGHSILLHVLRGAATATASRSALRSRRHMNLMRSRP